MLESRIDRVTPAISFDKKSNAQYASLCDKGITSGRGFESRLLHLIASLSESSAERAIIELMFDEGLRISDVLRIKPSDVDSSCFITVKQGKGSMIKVIRCSKNINFWLGQVRRGFVISDVYNRFYFYRLFKKYGLQMSIEGCSNKKVTHSLRYARASVMMKVSNDLETVKQDLGHKSIKSTKYYVRKSKAL